MTIEFDDEIYKICGCSGHGIAFYITLNRTSSFQEILDFLENLKQKMMETHTSKTERFSINFEKYDGQDNTFCVVFWCTEHGAPTQKGYA